MPAVKAGFLSQLPPDSVVEIQIEGKSIALCNAAGTIHALDGTCPHAGGPLGQGAVHEHMIVCPWHAWEYDCRTGENDYDPTVRVETYPVRLEGDDILIELPD